MSNNRYLQQFNDLYMKRCMDSYIAKNSYYNQYANMLENVSNNNTGFLRLSIVNQIDKKPIPNATITLYVTDGVARDIPVMLIISTINPIRIELPMANDLGTQIVGPEYNFSTYNLRVENFGYIASNVYNIRLFPNVTTDFAIELFPAAGLRNTPLIEERIQTPPHPRDELTNGM